jgi:NitT/TauT family transport system substrate-binding protein
MRATTQAKGDSTPATSVGTTRRPPASVGRTRRPAASAPGRSLRLLAALLIALAVASALAACGSSLRDEGGKQAAKQAGNGPRPIKLAGVFCVCFIGPYVAMKQGFFAQEGVPVKQYVATKGGSDTFQALQSGDVDFALSGLDAIIRGQSKGLKVRSVASVYPEFYAVTVRKGLAGQIRDIGDLKGRKVAISKIGSASWAFLQTVMRRAGLKEGDVKILQLGGIDTIVAGLKSGKVDAAVTWQPGTAQVQDAGIANVLVDVLRPADHRRLLGSTSSLGMTLAVRDELIEKNPDLVKRAVRALDKADAWIASHSASDVARVIAPLAPGVDRRVLTDAVRASMPMLPRSAAIRESAFRSSATVLKDAGVIDAIPPTNQAFACQFATCVK